MKGGNEAEMRKTALNLVSNGVQVITLLALNNDGSPSYCTRNAAYFTSLGIPVFACTPDLFPELMAAALSKQDIGMWRHPMI